MEALVEAAGAGGSAGPRGAHSLPDAGLLGLTDRVNTGKTSVGQSFAGEFRTRNTASRPIHAAGRRHQPRPALLCFTVCSRPGTAAVAAALLSRCGREYEGYRREGGSV